MKILIMGLSGSGKTFLSKLLQKELSCAWYNADNLREMANDWDFSNEGRKRQSFRMRALADFERRMEDWLFVISYVLRKKQEKYSMLTIAFGWTQ